MFRRRKRAQLATPSTSPSGDVRALVVRDPSEFESSSPSHSRRFSDSFRTIATSIDPTVTLHGSFSGSGNIEIRGQVEGDVHVDGLLLVVEGARIHGDVSATDAIIDGDLEGSLEVKEKLELRACCRVVGDIRASSMAMADGCRYEGTVVIGSDDGAARSRSSGSPVSFREKRSELAPVALARP